MKQSTRTKYRLIGMPCHSNTFEELFNKYGKAWAIVFQNAAGQGKSLKLCMRIADRFKNGGGKRKMKKKEKK